MAGKKKQKMVERTVILRNMVCNCCIYLLRKELDMEGIKIVDIRLGQVTLSYSPSKIKWSAIESVFKKFNFGIVSNKEKILVEQMKQAVIEMVHHTTFNAMVRNSDFLVEKFDLSYPYLSGLFSKHESTTLEKYIIMLKIEKVKELIDYGELTLSEIAYSMGYSSVQYLSTQFKSITGISVTEYKSAPGIQRTGLDNI
jgi:AraC family transcriptional regulator